MLALLSPTFYRLPLKAWKATTHQNNGDIEVSVISLKSTFCEHNFDLNIFTIRVREMRMPGT